MEHYNIFISDKVFPGLGIIQMDTYNRIKNTPDFTHENCGDFYSQITVKELPNVIYNSLTKSALEIELDKDITIIDNSQFNLETAHNDMYLIKEDSGVRIYSPFIHNHYGKDISLGYGIFLLTFADSLQCDNTQGSFYPTIKGIENGLNEIYRLLNKAKS